MPVSTEPGKDEIRPMKIIAFVITRAGYPLHNSLFLCHDRFQSEKTIKDREYLIPGDPFRK
jgi:hypothetical protein